VDGSLFSEAGPTCSSDLQVRLVVLVVVVVVMMVLYNDKSSSEDAWIGKDRQEVGMMLLMNGRNLERSKNSKECEPRKK
jgi:hypothetical protein